MTDTTLSEPPPTTKTAPGALADILLNLIVALLAPMFLGVTGGDIHFARAAAAETVSAYRARNDVDLVSIAQIIAFGLAALGSLSLSMADDLTLSMTLRLRNNANALDRSAERNRRTLHESRAAARFNDTIYPEHEEPYDEAAVIAAVAETKQAAQEMRARLNQVLQTRQQEAQPPAAKSPASRATMIQQENQAAWITAVSDAAAKITASLPNLPPAARQHASMQATALSNAANVLLSRLNIPPRGTDRPGSS